MQRPHVSQKTVPESCNTREFSQDARNSFW